MCTSYDLIKIPTLVLPSNYIHILHLNVPMCACTQEFVYKNLDTQPYVIDITANLLSNYPSVLCSVALIWAVKHGQGQMSFYLFDLHSCVLPYVLWTCLWWSYATRENITL